MAKLKKTEKDYKNKLLINIFVETVNFFSQIL